MDDLTANERSFIDLMRRSDEHINKGFALITKHRNFLKFFNELSCRGFFDPERNPSPIETESGYFQVPYWPALDYLLVCARSAGKSGDATLAKRIMEIITSVTDHSTPGGSRDNHHTFYRFAEIIGLLPIKAVSSNDLTRVETWLNTRFDRSLVANALNEGALVRFLRSPDTSDWDKALQLVDYCTKIENNAEHQPESIVEPFWIKEMIGNHAAPLGGKKRAEAAKLFEQRVTSVFGRGTRASRSQTFRPAVEDDRQNDLRHGVENVVVEGLRDAILAWCDRDIADAKSYIRSLLCHENQMLRRIGIYVLSRKWESLEGLYLPIVSPDLFVLEHLHELYGLLRDHFENFNNQEKAATIDAIRDIRLEPRAYREYIQRLWISAFSHTSYGSVANWFKKLSKGRGPLPDHPDYLSFLESRRGPGRSEYSAHELITFAKQRTIVDRLSDATRDTSFNTWDGPTVEALIAELEKAVGEAPLDFVDILSDFLDVRREYQYGLIRGFLRLWRAPEVVANIDDYDNLWSHLVDFFDQLMKRPGFWEIDDFSWQDVRPSWIKSSSISYTIADLLYYGTSDDRHAYPVSLMPRTWSLIQLLIGKCESISQPISDPMTQAIASSKGRAIDAAFSHTLRRLRIADQESATVHDEFRAFADREIERCVGGNFEFSTLCGACIDKLVYIDDQWLRDNIHRIFPNKFPKNMECALGGLAYVSVTRPIYQVLCSAGILDKALLLDLEIGDSQKALMRMLIGGYLLDIDRLDSSRFLVLFERSRVGYIELINDFLRQLSPNDLEPEQSDRVVNYWRRCWEWASPREDIPNTLLSGLGELTAFLRTIDGEDVDLLLAVVPYVNAYRFIAEMNRLALVSPKEVCKVLDGFINAEVSYYGYESRMLSLVKNLVERGCREEAISFCSKLHHIPGMETVYADLTE